EKGKAADATVYKKMIGCLMYLLATRPDMTFSVCLAARYMERPIEMHIAAVKRKAPQDMCSLWALVQCVGHQRSNQLSLYPPQKLNLYLLLLVPANAFG
ncbi:hypothetical protein A2U01_0054154, partial [Trifolium medium]|nr:hypothetical protein [Trifolium medium]